MYKIVLSGIAAALLLFAALNGPVISTVDAKAESKADAKVMPSTTCSGHYPSYFQDPAFSATGMWNDQVSINQPSAGYKGPVFRLSDAFGRAQPEAQYPWRKFNPFDASLTNDQRSDQSKKYIWAVMAYIQEGNTNSGNTDTDWTLCGNKVRPWFHIPYQTYEPLSGREFVHGLTREAPVIMAVNGGQQNLKTTVWAVGFYNPAAANSISKIWTGANAPKMPTENVKFNDGSVIGKLLFTTATAKQFPFLANMPTWRANISAPEFCSCTPNDKTAGVCTFKEQTEQCPRTLGEVSLMQFDIAVRDPRSPIGWAYGTFVADGQRRSGEKNPWMRISPLGLMWGNDTPPTGTLASAYPVDMRKNGSKDSAIFWDVVDTLNQHTNAGHLGCSGRLNGPADNATSSCLSCHQTASVPDKNGQTPAIIYQFSPMSQGFQQCVAQNKVKNLGTELEIDQTYFKNFGCATSFTGAASIVPPPAYESGAKDWVSTDFSLQLSISLAQWQTWDQHRKDDVKTRLMKSPLPAR